MAALKMSVMENGEDDRYGFGFRRRRTVGHCDNLPNTTLNLFDVIYVDWIVENGAGMLE